MTRALRLDIGTFGSNAKKLEKCLRVRAIMDANTVDEMPIFDYCDFDILREIDPMLEIEL